MSPCSWLGSHSATISCTAFAVGGDEQNRTVDPLLARQVLSQLSYAPISTGLLPLGRFHHPEVFLSEALKIKQCTEISFARTTSLTTLLPFDLDGLNGLFIRSVLHRKEVIQPHLPIRLPCYDFTPVANPTFGSALLKGQATDFGYYRLPWCDGRCVQGPGTYSLRHADPRLLAIPTSRRRVAACDPN